MHEQWCTIQVGFGHRVDYPVDPYDSRPFPEATLALFVLSGQELCAEGDTFAEKSPVKRRSAKRASVTIAHQARSSGENDLRAVVESASTEDPDGRAVQLPLPRAVNPLLQRGERVAAEVYRNPGGQLPGQTYNPSTAESAKEPIGTGASASEPGGKAPTVLVVKRSAALDDATTEPNVCGVVPKNFQLVSKITIPSSSRSNAFADKKRYTTISMVVESFMGSCGFFLISSPLAPLPTRRLAALQTPLLRRTNDAIKAASCPPPPTAPPTTATSATTTLPLSPPGAAAPVLAEAKGEPEMSAGSGRRARARWRWAWRLRRGRLRRADDQYTCGRGHVGRVGKCGEGKHTRDEGVDRNLKERSRGGAVNRHQQRGAKESRAREIEGTAEERTAQTGRREGGTPTARHGAGRERGAKIWWKNGDARWKVEGHANGEGGRGRRAETRMKSRSLDDHSDREDGKGRTHKMPQVVLAAAAEMHPNAQGERPAGRPLAACRRARGRLREGAGGEGTPHERRHPHDVAPSSEGSTSQSRARNSELRGRRRDVPGAEVARKQCEQRCHSEETRRKQIIECEVAWELEDVVGSKLYHVAMLASPVRGPPRDPHRVSSCRLVPALTLSFRRFIDRERHRLQSAVAEPTKHSEVLIGSAGDSIYTATIHDCFLSRLYAASGLPPSRQRTMHRTPDRHR
ncbi:hypothetical protein FB451DRAFT_1483077 [Mycena latifolia]|nr:hypothetical protein FB451DRAFT_1483077 [Mycena latifolia]